MSFKLKTLKFKSYLLGGIILCALMFLFWFLSRAFVTITVKPTNAIVLIDNKPLSINRYGIGRETLKGGKHQISIEADGYAGFFEEYKLINGFVKKIKISLREISDPVKISDGKFLSKGDENNLYYLGGGDAAIFRTAVALKQDGKGIQVDTLPLTDSKLSGIKEIVWSPDKQLALFRKADGVSLFDFKKYDFINQTETPWGRDIGDIAWSPDNSKIAYFYAPASGEKTLIFSNIANTEPTRVFNCAEVGIDNPILRWSPDSQWLLMVPRNKDYATNKIYLFNAYSRTLKAVTDIGSQTNAIFTLDGNKIVYSTYSKDVRFAVNTILSIMDLDGGNKKSLNLRANLTETAWSNQENLLILDYDLRMDKQKIINLNIASLKTSSLIPKNTDKKAINMLASYLNGKIIAYGIDNKIYAIRVD